jgi:hypothetical protein
MFLKWTGVSKPRNTEPHYISNADWLKNATHISLVDIDVCNRELRGTLVPIIVEVFGVRRQVAPDDFERKLDATSSAIFLGGQDYAGSHAADTEPGRWG